MCAVGEGGSVREPAFSIGGTSPNVCLSAQCGLLEALGNSSHCRLPRWGQTTHTARGGGSEAVLWYLLFYLVLFHGIPGGSEVKNPPANAGDTGLISELKQSPGEGNGNPLQYSRLGNPMDRGAWWATAHGVKESRHDLATKQQQISCL